MIAATIIASSALGASPERWPVEKANAWSRGTPWLAGCNFAPSSAINQLEMWQAETFDPETIDRELRWARELGFTSVRVFLHDIPWRDDREGFVGRIDQFLKLADKHRIGVMFVLFDSVWDPNPVAGKQPDPRPGLHNSGWVQSPGAAMLRDESRREELHDYVKGIVGRFADDPRVDVWDVWNEPDNTNVGSYEQREPPNKPDLVLPLLELAFAWAREANPSQPLTSGVWRGDWSDESKLTPIQKVQLSQSDVISFHSYGNVDEVKRLVKQLRRHERPIICTEYMARPFGSTFESVLAYFGEERIGAYNWGFVSGKSQTIYPWDSWAKPYPSEPPLWFHDIFHADGTPYRAGEIEAIRTATRIAKSRATGIAVIPQPLSVELAEGGFEISPDTKIVFQDASPEARRVAEYFAGLASVPTGFELPVASAARMDDAKGTIQFFLTADGALGEEGYTLRVGDGFVAVNAAREAGLFHGAQTLRQLLPPSFESGRHVDGVLWTIPGVVILDKPRFAWRGCLLDCSRHFMEKDFILRRLELMAYHKMNVFHWHLVDDQGWRLEIESHPKLTEIGAHRGQGENRYGGFYTKDDVREILRRAAELHITVVPEIEMPGHSRAALASYPHLSCTGEAMPVPDHWGIFKEIYCAGNDETFEFLEDVLGEVAELFPGKYIHIGGDEAPKESWKACPKCQKRIQDEGLADEHELQSYFIHRMQQFLATRGKSIVGWDEICEGGIPPGAVVQYWNNTAHYLQAVNEGHGVIASPRWNAYFDYPEVLDGSKPGWMPALPLEKVYALDPMIDGVRPEVRRNVLGAECTMWTEHAPQDQVEFQLYPRMAAFCEAVWSAPASRDYEGFLARLDVDLARLRNMGVGYSPLEWNKRIAADAFSADGTGKRP